MSKNKFPAHWARNGDRDTNPRAPQEWYSASRGESQAKSADGEAARSKMGLDDVGLKPPPPSSLMARLKRLLKSRKSRYLAGSKLIQVTRNRGLGTAHLKVRPFKTNRKYSAVVDG